MPTLMPSESLLTVRVQVLREPEVKSMVWVRLLSYKQYSFTIAANAAQLADLLRFKKSSSYWDN